MDRYFLDASGSGRSVWRDANPDAYTNTVTDSHTHTDAEWGISE